ncbi:MAG: hypothetical protein QXL94_06780 [Candidatus Parvarchaeum sp.]
MIQCPYCEHSFSGEGSYRMHKHRFHKNLEFRQPVATYEEVRQTATEPVEAESVSHEAPEPLQEEHEQQEPERRGKGGNDGLAVIGGLGAIAVVIIVALLGKKQ